MNSAIKYVAVDANDMKQRHFVTILVIPMSGNAKDLAVRFGVKLKFPLRIVKKELFK